MRPEVASALLMALFIAGEGRCAFASIRQPVEDAVLVDRSDLIVVARQATITDVGDVEVRRPHRAKIRVERVLKGDFKGEHLPVVIQAGLLPVVVRRSGDGRSAIEHRSPAVLGNLGDRLEIIDSSSSARGGPPIARDARASNVWFLRRVKDPARDGGPDLRGEFAISEPQDLRPASLEDYFRAYLADDPEDSVRRQLEIRPWLGESARRFLDHKQIERISLLADPAARADGLLPFFASNSRWESRCEAASKLSACGVQAGPPLMKFLERGCDDLVRVMAIDILSEVRYVESAGVMARLLRSREAFLTAQRFPDERAGFGFAEHPLIRELDRAYSEDIHLIMALGCLGDRQARDAIADSRRWWKNIRLVDGQILAECDRSIDALK